MEFLPPTGGLVCFGIGAVVTAGVLWWQQGMARLDARDRAHRATQPEDYEPVPYVEPSVGDEAEAWLKEVS